MGFDKKIISLLIAAILISAICGTVWGRTRYEDQGTNLFSAGRVGAGEKCAQIAYHNIGLIGLTITNQGVFGTAGTNFINPDSAQEIVSSCVYPYPNGNDYLFQGSFWIGAVIGRDTLVSVGADGWFQTAEMWPDPCEEYTEFKGYPNGRPIIRRSLSNPSDTDAVSELDFIAHYTDTVTDVRYVTNDPIDNRPHVPLNIEITQRSYSWSYDYADDFVLFDYSIKNIGRRDLNKVYMGLYVDGDVGARGGDIQIATDDICGFRRTIPSPISNLCGWIDTINIAWISDNNGLNNDVTDQCGGDGGYPANMPTSVTGMRVVRTPSDSLKYSFNWWISNGNAALDFGPRKVGTPEDPFRDWGYLGTPDGDANKYFIMRHEEFDYDQLFTGKDNTADGWFPPPPQSTDFANGYDTRYLLSFGPFDIYPGEVLPLTFAYVAGPDFHPPQNCNSYTDLFSVNNPELYYGTLNFTDFGANAIWASWIYDNPGVDTDNDGLDSGKYRICVYDVDTISADSFVIKAADTVWYEGDGVPDFKGASPPPAPELWVIQPYPAGDTVRCLYEEGVDQYNAGFVRVRWYGYRSENTRDVFSGDFDYEGYRVYRSLSANPEDFVLIASFDRNDFNKYIYVAAKNAWELNDPPFTLEALHSLYGENFNPYDWGRDRPFSWMDSAFYFAPQDWNMSDLEDTLGIHKMYPDEPYPSTLDHDTAAIYYPDELTDYGYFKYFMYEFTDGNLLPSQKYYFAVTAFDFGSPKSKLKSLETPVNRNMVAVYPLNKNSTVMQEGLKVVVWPNPYRADAGYLDPDHFEGRDNPTLPAERQRRIHFTNIPNKCTIRIFSIDGDLVREIEHDCQGDWPLCNHAEWDLITRNTQAVVSGIYYYSVESESGTQIGKIVIIL